MSALEFISVQHSNIISLDLDLTTSYAISTENFIMGFSAALKPKLLNLSLKLNRIEDLHLDVISATCPKLVNLELRQSDENDSAQVSHSSIATTFEKCSHLKSLKIFPMKVDNVSFDKLTVEQREDFVAFSKQ